LGGAALKHQCGKQNKKPHDGAFSSTKLAIKKNRLDAGFFIAESGLFLAVFAFEAIHTTGSINNVLFAGIERVGLAADINAHQRIFFTIGPSDCFFGLDGGTSQDGEVGAVVFEDDRTVVRMNIGFHEIS